MWIYNNKEYNKIHDSSLFGFTYYIVYTNPKTGEKKKYIGRKQFFSEINKKLGKKELAAREDKRSSKKKKIIKESDWLTYQSSNIFLKSVDKKHIKKYILEFAKSKIQLTYLETKYLFKHDVLFSNEWLNDNIMGKFFKSKLE